ncbi:preprotein translocase subunit SecG [Salegentibacter agarivorans]|jgi:preprotein translocase subunit SecG|uniref:preprotein translocase subunit SecG n=1 Tax=unclassified Salegentibacter TaxID=2633436 RepID=UPI00094A7E5C|nr:MULTISPECIES: preprotein translocase subunit SecG [unclassified Salegentibacter]APS38487.1 preprotein translocase subunit SecG [Salegentibacter sp. T436]MBO2544007.1 preprotein translocase subunit SecG [Salegentibacter sp. BDJ18]|tara:strand:- start:398 stop:742 length:345 start_codon:yes stop_codon:yes gene_type:complete
MSTFTIFLALIVIVAFLLVVVIMVQNPKGGGLSSSFGGSGQQVGGVKKTGDFLDKSTWTLATLLLVLILLSNVTIMDDSSYGESRVFDEDAMPENTATPPAQMPGQQSGSDSDQ